ncbi:hypothetical protein LXL04_011163 [Taraxacum kok-saghyz]
MKGKHKSLDRISALPQDTIEKILTLMPLKDALRTSILSKKWRYSWTTIPKLVFDDNMIVSSRNIQVDKYKFVSTIFHVFLQHKAPILEFSLTITDDAFSSEIDQIILHLSRSNNNIKKFAFENWGTISCVLPRPIFSLEGLEHLHLTYCDFEPPLLNKGFRYLMQKSYNPDIELNESEWVELLKCLPSVQVLELSQLIIKHLDADDMPQKQAISLPNLRILVLDICFIELSFVLYMISGSPNLEKIKLKMCVDHDQLCVDHDLPDIQDYTGLKLDHLKEMEITSFNNNDLEMDFVKLIMANSPVLKKARVELNSDVSVDEEVKMLRDMMNIPFLRTSPITIERPKDD